nr:NADH dehydrogenase subunit 6 [Microdon globosus]
MIQLNLYMLIMTTTILFMKMNHPLSMGMMLLIQTTLIACMTGLITKTFWFSYILFLIFVGGMLVLFIYVTSLASNEKFLFSMKILMILMTLFFMINLLFYMNKFLMFYMNNNEMNIIINMNSYTPENILNLNKIYNYPTNMLTILLINYLLITLIATVKITKLFYGPLRTLF